MGKLFDLDVIFKLDEIPIEELNKQYYDISLVHCFCGFGNPLIEGYDGSFLVENEKKVALPNEIKDALDQKYGFENWQFKIFYKGNDIYVFLCIALYYDVIFEIIRDMEQLGYFASQKLQKFDKVGRKWIKFQFEPMYQVSETTKILERGDLLHATPVYNWGSIQENGLQPRSENHLFDYPNRIYCFIGNIPINELYKMCYTFYKNNKNPNNDGKYILLSIDSKKLLENKYDFYYDPNYKYGTFTDKPIPPDFIRFREKLEYDKN